MATSGQKLIYMQYVIRRESEVFGSFSSHCWKRKEASFSGNTPDFFSVLTGLNGSGVHSNQSLGAGGAWDTLIRIKQVRTHSWGWGWGPCHPITWLRMDMKIWEEIFAVRVENLMLDTVRSNCVSLRVDQKNSSKGLPMVKSGTMWVSN